MTWIIKLTGTVAFLAVTGFCVYGFMATYESPDFWPWRILYGVLGGVSLLGAGWLLRK